MSVVEFPKTELGYWVCNCGCSTHFVRTDGEIECAHCSEFGKGIGHWKRPNEEFPRRTTDADPEVITTITGDMPVDFTMKRFAGCAAKGEFDILIGIRNDGTLKTVGDFCDTSEQHIWLRRMLRQAYRMLRQ